MKPPRPIVVTANAYRRRRVRAGRTIAFGPPPVRTISVAVSAQGLYRVADPNVEGYELYRGLAGADPDFTGLPYATFTSLPYTTGAVGNNTHRFVLRYRNRFGLLSQNVDVTQIVVTAGTETPRPPSGPYEVTADAAAAGTVTITARYRPFADYVGETSYAADAWLLYVTTDGSDPSLATPTETSMGLATEGQGDGIVELSYTTSAQLEGTTVNALVRTRRNGTPDADSTNTSIVTATATLLGPAVVNPADGFYGSQDRQQT